MLEATGLGTFEAAYCMAVVFVAGLVRGYSGFGFSALVMASLALVILPAQIVPVVLALEVLATLVLYRRISGDIAWRPLSGLVFGAVIATPAGLFLLRQLPADTVRLVLSILILCACAALWRAPSLGRGMQGGFPAFGAGLVSGVVNGVAAIGGLPAVMYLLAAVPAANAFRATSMVYILLLDCFGFAAAWYAGLVDQQVFARIGLFLLPSLAGLFVGNRRFLAANPESFRRFAIALLAAVAVIGIVRVIAA